MQKRYEVKKQKKDFYMVNDNESKNVTLMSDGTTKPSLWVAINMTKQDAEKLADRLNLRHVWGV